MPENLDDFYNPLKTKKQYTDFGLTDEADTDYTTVDISEYIDEQALEEERYKISPQTLQMYDGIDTRILQDIEIYTKLRDGMVTTGVNEQDSLEMEVYRNFPKGLLQKHGVFYCTTSIDLMRQYPYLRNSSLYLSTNDTYNQRYILPICLPTGEVYTHMGYCPPDQDDSTPKYMMSGVPWVDQGCMVGHLESFIMYPNSKTVYVCEGMMDAYRISDVMQSPSIALLGHDFTLEKQGILQMYVDEGYKLIYVKDNDEAGTSEIILKSPLFSNLLDFDPDSKDIDESVVKVYLQFIKEHADTLYLGREIGKVPVIDIPLEEKQKLDENIKSSFKMRFTVDLFGKSTGSVFDSILSSFRC